MGIVTTVQIIDLPQLIAEVGCDLEMSDDGTLRVISGDVDQQVLNDAVAAHVPPSAPRRVDEAARAALQSQIDQLSDLVLGI